MTSPTPAQIKQNQYEAVALDFVRHRNGRFLAVTDDSAFLSVLRTVLGKHLMLNVSDVLTWQPEPDQLLRVLNSMEEGKQSPLLFIERHMRGRDLGFLIRQVKQDYPGLYIVALTVDVERQRIMYLHEAGADNFIVKPVSAATILEKIASTLQPQTKLGQIIDSAKALLEQGQAENTRSLALQVLELKPGSAAGFMLLGDAEHALGNLDRAREAYENACQSAGLYLEPLHKLADLCHAAGDQQGRLHYLEKLNILSPLNVDRKVCMGEIHLGFGQWEKADQLFEAALDQAAKDALAQVGELSGRIAQLYAHSDPSRSEAFLRRALSAKAKILNREDIKLFNQLGISLRQQGKWQEAVEEYRKALAIAPEDENLHYNLAMAQSEGKQFREARQNMVRALALNERLPYSSANIAYNMGVVFTQSGDRDRARQTLEIALELKPDMALAKAALGKLG